MVKHQAEHQVERQKLRLSMIARRQGNALIGTTFGMTLGLILLLTACSKVPPKTATAKPQPTQPSAIKVDVKGAGRWC